MYVIRWFCCIAGRSIVKLQVIKVSFIFPGTFESLASEMLKILYSPLVSLKGGLCDSLIFVVNEDSLSNTLLLLIVRGISVQGVVFLFT